MKLLNKHSYINRVYIYLITQPVFKLVLSCLPKPQISLFLSTVICPTSVPMTLDTQDNTLISYFKRYSFEVKLMIISTGDQRQTWDQFNSRIEIDGP